MSNQRGLSGTSIRINLKKGDVEELGRLAAVPGNTRDYFTLTKMMSSV